MIWVLNKSILLGSNSLKVSLCDIVYFAILSVILPVILFVILLVLFDMQSEKAFYIVGSNCLNVRILFNFLTKCFFTVYFKFSCFFFWPLRWLWLENNFVYICLSWSFSLQLFSASVGHLNNWVSLVYLDWYHFRWKWNSSNTQSKRQIIEKKLIQNAKRKAYLFLSLLYFVNNFRIKLFTE